MNKTFLEKMQPPTLASAVDEINRLRAELEAAKRDCPWCAQLRVIVEDTKSELEAARAKINGLTSELVQTQQRRKEFEAQNARLAAALEDSVAREWPNKTALATLLAPVLQAELQTYALSVYPGENQLVKVHPSNATHQFYKREDVDQLITRMRSLCGERKE